LRERVEETIAFLGMQRWPIGRTGGFSQGERMKTALGRALIHSPRNLLLDEPTSGLDSPRSARCASCLQRTRDAGACIVFSSHVLEEVQALCDRVVILAQRPRGGRRHAGELCGRAGAPTLEDAFVAFTGAEEVRHAEPDPDRRHEGTGSTAGATAAPCLRRAVLPDGAGRGRHGLARSAWRGSQPVLAP
jgi:ABC-type Na+ transport system ATPase subunit NatA